MAPTQHMDPAEEAARLRAEHAMLARSISHDLRQPLHVISGYIELVAFKYRDQLDPKGEQLIDKALAGVDRMNTMIDGVVGLMRVDLDSPWEPAVDMNQVVDDAITLLRPQADPLGAQLERRQLPSIPGRPALLSTVVEQLLGNVLRFPGDGAPRGLVSARPTESGVRFEVRDQGPGIDERLHRSIFEPFGRGQDPRAGTGMGLAICRKIIGLHGGSFGLVSAPGEGSTFWFELPR